MSSVLAESDLDSLSKRRARELEQGNRRYLRKQRAEQAGWTQTSREDIISRIRRNITKQDNEIDEQFQQRIRTCDLLVSLFASSLFNYRRASVCDPFPNHLVNTNTNEKLFEQAELYMKGMPDIHHFAANPRAISNLPQTGLTMLDWILHPEFDGLSVRQVPLTQFKQEFERDLPRRRRFDHLEPQHVFQLDYHAHHDYAAVFDALKAQHGVLRGYHGSGFENVHSIVRNGLDATYAKESSLFGTGIYLSTDRDVAYGYLKPGLNSGANSVFGAQVGCVLCCEVVRHSTVKRAASNGRAPTEFSVHSENDVPRGYIVAPSSELVLVKYVLVYCDFTPPARKRRNVCRLMLLAYIAVLLFIWFVKSNHSRLFFTTHSPLVHAHK